MIKISQRETQLNISLQTTTMFSVGHPSIKCSEYDHTKINRTGTQKNPCSKRKRYSCIIIYTLYLVTLTVQRTVYSFNIDSYHISQLSSPSYTSSYTRQLHLIINHVDLWRRTYCVITVYNCVTTVLYVQKITHSF